MKMNDEAIKEAAIIIRNIEIYERDVRENEATIATCAEEIRRIKLKLETDRAKLETLRRNIGSAF